MTILGVWIDDAPRLVRTPAYWDRLHALGFRSAAIMIEGSGTGWDPSWTVDAIGRVGELARDRDVQLALTCWPEPSRAYLDAMGRGMPPLLTAAGAIGWEVDAEGNWTAGRVRGFRPADARSAIDLAGDYLVEVMRTKRPCHEIRMELTTFTSHTENGRAADVAPECDVLFAQAYSVRHRKNAQGKEIEIAWDHSYGPGRMQRLTLDRSLLVRGVGKIVGPRLGAGLAAYDQGWPGKKPEDAMRIAYETAMGYEPIEIRWWSSKHVFGAKANPYAARAIRALASPPDTRASASTPR